MTWRFSIRAGALPIGTFAVALALAGCSDKDIRTYRAPKDPGIALAPPAEMPDGNAQPGKELPPGVTEGPALSWEAPANWQPRPGDAARRASFAIGTGDTAAEVAITVFPGDAGGILANVNRWRGQAGLPSVEPSALGSATAGLDVGALHFTVVDAIGSSRRIVAAMAPWQGATWFFKLTGGSAAVAQAKPDFLAFLKSVRAPHSP